MWAAGSRPRPLVRLVRGRPLGFPPPLRVVPGPRGVPLKAKPPLKKAVRALGKVGKAVRKAMVTIQGIGFAKHVTSGTSLGIGNAAGVTRRSPLPCEVSRLMPTRGWPHAPQLAHMFTTPRWVPCMATPRTAPCTVTPSVILPRLFGKGDMANAECVPDVWFPHS